MLNYNPHDRHNIKLHLQITLLQPLSHISESVGNQTNLRTMKVTDLEGNPSEVFCLSGNSLRNRILRRCGIDIEPRSCCHDALSRSPGRSFARSG